MTARRAFVEGVAVGAVVMSGVVFGLAMAGARASLGGPWSPVAEAERITRAVFLSYPSQGETR